MRKSMRVKHFVAPALLTLAAMGLGTGCSSAKSALGGLGSCGTGDAGASLTAKFDAFKAAVTDLNAVQGTITSKVAIACVNIAKGLDSTTNASLPTYTAGQVVSSTDTNTACNAASAAIAKIKANGAVTIAVVASAPSCTVDASAQVDCNAKCDVSASCTAPTVEASCSPADLSGECKNATCSGSCTVEATVAATCNGTCNGTCEGTCNGQTGTAGNGVACNGTCSAGCKGECKAAAGATANCTGTCSGGCSVAYTAPKCDVALTPPACDAAADCNAGCNGSASLTATCTPPAVKVTITGTAAASVQTTLEANLPDLLEIAAQAQLAGTSVADLGAKAAGVATAFTAEVGCAVQYGADFATNLTAALTASTNVSVSFQASASVSGSASG